MHKGIQRVLFGASAMYADSSRAIITAHVILGLSKTEPTGRITQPLLLIHLMLSAQIAEIGAHGVPQSRSQKM